MELDKATCPSSVYFDIMLISIMDICRNDHKRHRDVENKLFHILCTWMMNRGCDVCFKSDNKNNIICTIKHNKELLEDTLAVDMSQHVSQYPLLSLTMSVVKHYSLLISPPYMNWELKLSKKLNDIKNKRRNTNGHR